ncbi:MAG: hypothetical protein AAFQ98_10325 [Bacteroidota bacterium]
MSIKESIINHLSHPPDLPYAEMILSRQFGKEKAQAILASGYKACDVHDEEESLGTRKLERLYKYLSTQEGKVGVYGMSLLIQLKSYTNLKAFSNNLSR